MSGGEVEFLRLTGQPRAKRGSDEISFLPDKRYQLLGYLAFDSGWVGRERAAFLFWPDSDTESSRGNLRGLIQRLRTLPFEPGLEANKHQLRWNVPTDLQVFNRAVENGDARTAIDSYSGPLLAGLETDDAGEFGEWLEIAREELRSRWRALALSHLAAMGHGAEREAESLVRRLLHEDPLDEEAVRTFLTTMGRLGQPVAARGLYNEFMGRLERELRLEPTAETVAAFEALRDIDSGAPGGPQVDAESSNLGSATRTEATTAGASRSTRLPVPTTSFIARERELAEVVERILDPDCRLLSLVGQGGVGKTRLALAAAARVLDVASSTFAEGALFVALDVVHSAEEVVPTLAETLGIVPVPGIDSYQQVEEALGDARRLLVLDNFEHVVGAAGFLSDLLAAAPGVKVLTTTRERLGLAAEWTYQLEGLDFPDASTSLEELTRFGAARLLVDRARRVRPDFRIEERDLPALERLWALTQGLPLAIELAAAWLRAVPLADLVDDISDNLDMLATATRDSIPRHASIRAVFEQSWAQLTEAERSALRKLAVFAAPVTPEAATFVAGAARATIAALIDKSLLRLNRLGRYDRHPLLYAFTKDKLAVEQGERTATEARHASYYLRFLRERTDRARGPQPATVMDEIAAEMREVNNALRRLIVTGATGELVEFMEVLELDIGYFRARGYGDDVLELLSSAASAASDAGQLAVARDLRGRLGDAFGIHRGDQVGALREYGAAAELARQAGEIAREAVFVSLCGVMRSAVAEGSGWEELDRALGIARASGDSAALSTVLEHRAYVLGQSGNVQEARRYYSESLAVIEDPRETEHIDPADLARRRYYAVLNLGDMDHRLGDVEKALAAKQEALQLAVEMSNPILQAHVHFGFGEMFSDLNRRDEAQRHLATAASLYEQNNVTAQLTKVRLVAARYGYQLSSQD